MPTHPREGTAQHDAKCPTAITKLSYGSAGIKLIFSVEQLQVRNKNKLFPFHSICPPARLIHPLTPLPTPKGVLYVN